MSEWPNNGFPPSTEGVGGAQGPEETSGQRGIVPAGPDGGARREAFSAPASVFLCVLGGAVASSSLPLVGSLLVGSGVASASERLGVRGIALCLPAALLPAVLLTAAVGPSAMVAAAMCCLAAFLVVGPILRERMTPGLGCVIVAALALGQLGADALIAAADGTTVAAGVEALLDAYQQQLGTEAGVGALMQQVRSVMMLLWPLAYVITAIGEYLFATFGVEFMVRRSPERAARLPKLVDYDLPVWIVAVLVAAAAGIAFGLTATGDAAEATLMVSVNLAMALRFAFAAQGLAVLAWFLRRRQVGNVASAFLGGIALYLEVQFVVLTIAGLLDVWANFRHLTRGTAQNVQETAE